MRRCGALLGAAVALGCAGCELESTAVRQSPPPAEVSVAEFEQWRAGTPWHSREELLQFFADHDQDYRARGALVEPLVIARMSAELSSMFPLAACTRIVYADGLLHISLRSAQVVRIPGAYHQAFFDLPKELVFSVTPPEGGDAPWRFHVQDGRVRLEFSWLAELIGPSFLHDFDVDDLTYAIDRAHHSASLSVHNTIHRDAQGELRVNGHAPGDASSTAAFLRRFLDNHTDQATAANAAVLYTEDYGFDLETRHLKRLAVHWSRDDGQPPAPPGGVATSAAPAPPLAPAPPTARP